MSLEKVEQHLKKRNLGYDPPTETKMKVAKMMEKYGDNDWWDSNDVVIRAYYQLFENCFIIPLDDFHKGLEILMGRPVFTSEFVDEDLKKEAIERMKIYEAGGNLDTTKEYQERKVEYAIYKLQKIATKNGSRVIEVDLAKGKVFSHEDSEPV